jgi:hypothetical protein
MLHEPQSRFLKYGLEISDVDQLSKDVLMTPANKS